jgi:uncharacterized protein YcnI
MNGPLQGRLRLSLTLVCVSAIALVAAASAGAHARISPAVSLSNELQLYSLAVPTEKANATTTKIVLNLPANFSIDSFVPSPGWTRSEKSTGSGDSAVVTQVTWTGGATPTEEDSLFQFLAQPAKSGTYTFQVQQTYSDGSIVNWADPETGQNPAPTIEAKSSLGAGSAILPILALVLGAIGILVGGVALFSRGGSGTGARPLA